MNIIFLDIDGVLNSDEWYKKFKNNIKKWPQDNIDPNSIFILNELIESINGDVRIVISSTWRQLISINDLSTLLEFYGFKYKDKIIDKTPIGYSGLKFNEYPQRGKEIQAWLHTNEKKYNIKSFVILDDVNIGYLKDKWLQIDAKNGLQKRHIRQALEILSKQ